MRHVDDLARKICDRWEGSGSTVERIAFRVDDTPEAVALALKRLQGLGLADRASEEDDGTWLVGDQDD